MKTIYIIPTFVSSHLHIEYLVTKIYNNQAKIEGIYIYNVL